MALTLESTDEADDAADSVLALVAVDEDGPILGFEDELESLDHVGVVHFCGGFLVDGEAEVECLDVLRRGPVGHVGAVVFGAEVEDGFEVESTEEFKVALVGVAGAVDAA